MQSLPVSTAPPAHQLSAPTPADSNNNAPVTEPFGSVLARQRANSKDVNQPETRQPAATPVEATATQNGNGSQAPLPDSAVTLAADILAGLLPVSTATNLPNSSSQSTALDGTSTLTTEQLAKLLPASASKHGATTKEKSKPQATAPDGTSTLPSEMLAMLLPATAHESPKTPAPAPDGSNTLPADMLAMLTPAAVSQVNTRAIKDATESSSGAAKTTPTQPLLELSASQKTTSSSKVGAELSGAAANINPNKQQTFSNLMESLAKDGAKALQLDAAAAIIHKQTGAPPAVDILQNSNAPIVTGQNGSAQVASAVINTPVTDRAWGDEFSQKITWMATQQDQTAELHLNPPNLGPLDVVLNVSGDQATALFTSPHAAVRDAIEQALPKLREMLADNGITLGNAMVSDQSPKDQQAWQTGQRESGNRNSTGSTGTAVSTAGIATVATQPPGRRHQGMVDTFA
jgi:flagellar hook-length control protein FliK